MSIEIKQGDAATVLATMPSESVQCAITSPPYWGLRDYGVTGQLGLEKTPDEYVAHLVEVFREVRRVLRDDGTLWLNLGSSYAGSGKGGNPEGSPWSGFVGKEAREKSAKVRAIAASNANDTFALRDDLTPAEIAYVLSELASSFKGDEVAVPDLAVSVDEAVAGFAD